MELVTSSCFLGLSRPERNQQMYAALYNWADDTDLLYPLCFPGVDDPDAYIMAALAVQGGTGTQACIMGYTPEVRLYYFYVSLFDIAGDDTLPDPDCFLGMPQEARRQAVYAAFYSMAGDDTLTDPDCFWGLSPDEQEAALFAALSITSEGQLTLDAVTGLNVVGDEDGTWDADWDPMGDADYYQYRIDGGPVTDTFDVAVGGAGLAPGTYEFEVRSRDNEGNRGPWVSQNFTISTGTYLRPGGVDGFRRPDTTSLFLRP
jgi:hypothetical protein